MAQALYRQVYEDLVRRIEAGEWSIGQRLPSQAELTTEFSVSAITITRALDMLRTDGYVTRRPRIGTVVQARRPVTERRGLPTIGYIVPAFDDAFGTPVLTGLLDAAADRAHVVLGTSHGEREREQALIDQQLELGVDALVMLPGSSQFMAPQVMALAARSFPMVIVDRTLGGVPVNTVCSDNVAGGRLAAEHLFELGHRELCLVMSPNDLSTLAQRRQGFVDAHASQQVSLGEIYTDVRSVVPGTTVTPDDDVAALGELLARRGDVSGYVVTEYHSALLLRYAARHQGLRVPQDLSIVCFDCPQEYAQDVPRLTHVRQDQYRIGTLALESALAQVAEPGALTQEQVPVTLVAGRSSAVHEGG